MNDQFDAIADAGHRTAQAGGLTALLGGITSSAAGVLFGMLIGAVGLAVQVYYRRKQDKREADLQALKIKLMQDGYEARAALLEDSAK